MEKGSAPGLLPIFRSRQQAELLALVLGNTDTEFSLTGLAAQLSMPVSSVHREIERAESAGLLESRKIGNTRLVRANLRSPYFKGLAEVLIKAFGPPQILNEVLSPLDGLESAYIFGSWAASLAGDDNERPVGDIDLLVLGSPDRDTLYEALSAAEQRLGRPVQATIRPAGWLAVGTGNFHATVTQRPLVKIQTTNI